MEPYSEITLEGIKFDLWGDFEDNEESIHKKKMIPSDYSSEMINKIGDFERRYPLSKDLLQRMLDLGLEVERESTPAALDLIRFINNRVMKSDFGLEVEIESTIALDLIRFIKQQLNEE
ncbi:hypothetical protein Tco_1226437 [Tanacetum coccineum]